MRGVHDVAVVGGGLIGSALAVALRAAGFDALLLDRGPAAAPEPPADDLRVYAITPAAMRWLGGLGAWKALGAAVSPYEAMQVWESDPQAGLEFRAEDLGEPVLGSIVSNGRLLAALRALLPADAVRGGCEVTQLDLQGAVPALELADGSRLRARLVVCAEGADARLREQAGIEVSGWAYPQRAIVCNVRTELAHRRTAWQRFLPGGPLAFLPLADGRCSIVWTAEETAAANLLDMPDPLFRRRLGEAFQERLGEILEVTPRLSFPLRLQHAERYVVPGFALVGDSAHALHPLAGQGVNLGFADAETLVRVLAEAHAARRDICAERTLRRYERARKAGNLEMLALTDGLHRLFRAGGMAEPLRRIGLQAVAASGLLRRSLARRALGSAG